MRDGEVAHDQRQGNALRRPLEWPRQVIMRDSTGPVPVARESRNIYEAKSAGLSN